MNPEAEARWIIRAGLSVIVAGMLALGGWAALAPLSGAVIAPGYVKVDLNRKVVQHQEGGIVREILGQVPIGEASSSATAGTR